MSVSRIQYSKLFIHGLGEWNTVCNAYVAPSYVGYGYIGMPHAWSTNTQTLTSLSFFNRVHLKSAARSMPEMCVCVVENLPWIFNVYKVCTVRYIADATKFTLSISKAGLLERNSLPQTTQYISNVFFKGRSLELCKRNSAVMLARPLLIYMLFAMFFFCSL